MSTESQFIEVVRFNLKDGATEDALLATERAIRAGAIRQQAGYQGRDLHRDVNGSWLVIIRWDSRADADAWSSLFKSLPEGRAFGSLLNFATARREDYTGVSL